MDHEPLRDRVYGDASWERRLARALGDIRTTLRAMEGTTIPHDLHAACERGLEALAAWEEEQAASAEVPQSATEALLAERGSAHVRFVRSDDEAAARRRELANRDFSDLLDAIPDAFEQAGLGRRDAVEGRVVPLDQLDDAAARRDAAIERTAGSLAAYRVDHVDDDPPDPELAQLERKRHVLAQMVARFEAEHGPLDRPLVTRTPGRWAGHVSYPDGYLEAERASWDDEPTGEARLYAEARRRRVPGRDHAAAPGRGRRRGEGRPASRGEHHLPRVQAHELASGRHRRGILRALPCFHERAAHG